MFIREWWENFTAGQQQNLAKLQQVIEDQTQLIQPLTMLSGRLELLLAQTESADGVTDDTVGAEKVLFTCSRVIRIRPY